MVQASEPQRLDPLEDQRLVDLCLGGSRGAWEALVRRHERLVFAVARAYRLSDQDIADVFQEVFGALVRGLPRLREPRALVRWLATTSQRIARAIALRRRREVALARHDPAEVAGLAATEPPVGADLERLEQQALVRLALASLSPRCQELLSALYYQDPPPAYSDISRRFGMPIGSIGPTRARCFERVRAALDRLLAEGSGISESPARTFEPEKGRAGFRLGSLEPSGFPPREDFA